jgi:hypothetical protein
MSIAQTKQGASLHHVTHDAALTTIAMSNAVILSKIVIAIAHMTMSIKRQSALASSTPALATERMTIVTISLKS